MERQQPKGWIISVSIKKWEQVIAFFGENPSNKNGFHKKIKTAFNLKPK